jgi:hypothetical protein
MKFTSIVLALAVAANQFGYTFAGAEDITVVADTATTTDGKPVVIRVLDNDTFDDGSGTFKTFPVQLANSNLNSVGIFGPSDITPAFTAAGGTVTITGGASANILFAVGSDISTCASGVAIAPGSTLPSFTVTPPPGYVGVVTFTYKNGASDVLCGGLNSVGSATVKLTILAAIKQTFELVGDYPSGGAQKITYEALRGKNQMAIGGLPDSQFVNLLNNVYTSKTPVVDNSLNFINQSFANLFNLTNFGIQFQFP